MKTTIVAILFWFGTLTTAMAQEVLELANSKFPVEQMSQHDSKLLQFSLKARGLYHGGVDGNFGEKSEAALRDFAERSFDDLPRNIHVGVLIAEWIKLVSEERWEYVSPKGMSLHYAVPLERLTEQTDRSGVRTWKDSQNLILVQSTRSDVRHMNKVHRNVELELSREFKPYTVRRPRLVVTSGTTNRSTDTYLFSQKQSDGLWDTIYVDTVSEEGAFHRIVVGSISDIPITMTPEQNSFLAQIVKFSRAAIALLQDQDGERDTRPSNSGKTREQAPMQAL
ncbi:MAG: peptidoglycan-binding domain-containing protein [Pseudomonadota bacterium]